MDQGPVQQAHYKSTSASKTPYPHAARVGVPGQGFRGSRKRFDHEEKPPWGSWGRVLLEEEVEYKEYRFELVQT